MARLVDIPPMSAGAYYNENDPNAAAWLRQLIKAGHIAPGIVDERSIEDVRPEELVGFKQCHFFAGIGVWSYALRQAGWPDDRPVWTGSCPCQGFSVAGKQKGFADERHLWPAFRQIIDECRPATVFGEQVASKAAEPWFDLVQADLEALDYAFGCIPFPAAGVGAPHIRDRAYWVGHTSQPRLEGHTGDGDAERGQGRQDTEPDRPTAEASSDGWLAADGGPAWRHCECCDDWYCHVHDMHTFECDCPGIDEWIETGFDPYLGRMADPASNRLSREGESAEAEAGWETRPHVGWQLSQRPEGRGVDSEQPAALRGSDGDTDPRPTDGFWRDSDWLRCRDGKWRGVEPGLEPLVNGPAGFVGQGSDIGFPTAEARQMRLKGYGNAIVAPQAQTFIECAMEIIE